VGESYYQDNLERICGPRTAEGVERRAKAVLVFEDDNPYDHSAVRVEIDGLKVGHLSKEMAPRFRLHMRMTFPKGIKGRMICDAEIRGGWSRPGSQGKYGVWLDI
jgi:hypothetical protein